MISVFLGSDGSLSADNLIFSKAVRLAIGYRRFGLHEHNYRFKSSFSRFYGYISEQTKALNPSADIYHGMAVDVLFASSFRINFSDAVHKNPVVYFVRVFLLFVIVKYLYLRIQSTNRAIDDQ